MSDAFVIVAPDSTGKKIDTSELTQDGGSVVERQRVVHGDPSIVDALGRIELRGDQNVLDIDARELLQQILIELRVLSAILGHSSAIDPDALRIALHQERN